MNTVLDKISGSKPTLTQAAITTLYHSALAVAAQSSELALAEPV